jgi:hypothetical protein
VTGAELDRAIAALAVSRHVLAFHWPDSTQVTARGWPDWVFIGPRGILFREAKSDSDQLSSDQKKVGYALQALKLDWACWDSWDLRKGVIEYELGEIA